MSVPSVYGHVNDVAIMFEVETTLGLISVPDSKWFPHPIEILSLLC